MDISQRCIHFSMHVHAISSSVDDGVVFLCVYNKFPATGKNESKTAATRAADGRWFARTNDSTQDLREIMVGLWLILVDTYSDPFRTVDGSKGKL